MSNHPTRLHSWKKPKKPLFSINRLWARFRQTPIGRNILLILVFLFITGTLAIVGIFAYASRDLPSPNSLSERKVSQATKIFDRTGEHLLYEIAGNQNRTLKQFQSGFCDKDQPTIPLDPKGIPLFAVQATIAAEDRKFCEHHGFDFKGFARAVFLNVIGQRVGGSTLTQQLVKNAILSNEKTLTRKIKELILSLELEQRYSKDEILQIYFNEIPYGSSFYGIEAASQNFFGKTVSDLTVAESATLAALPQAPTRYLNNPDMLKARRDYILSIMKELGFIDDDTLTEALAEDSGVNVRITNIFAPHFVMEVKADLEETYGRRTVEEGGLKVYTTLDYRLQEIAEEEVKKGTEARGEQYGFSNAALMAEDPKTGQILAMVGSKDFFDKSIDGQVNVTTRLRQPGSSFKPIVFTKAFEMGYTPNTVLWDVTTTFPTSSGPYTPNNYDLKERGPIQLRNALQMSLNIPAVKTAYLVGVENILDFATSLGYDSFKNPANFGLSVALGGGEVRLNQHLNAYAAFANEGKQFPQVKILKVTDSTGSVLEEWKPRDPKQVIDENAARMISNVLSDNNARTPVFGQNNNLQLGDRPVAAKSGTTNNFHDAWLMGYTPSLAAGVWVGNNNNAAMKNKADGSVVAGPIWNGFMKRALEGTNIESFTNPTIESTGKPVLDGSLGGQVVVIDRASGKLATNFTPDSFKVTHAFGGYHEILQYVSPSDPRGPAPENPQDDEQYSAWEQGVQTWLAKREKETGISLQITEAPTEYDDVHVPANTPTIRIESPLANQWLDTRSFTVSVSASAPRGLSRIEFFLDDAYLGNTSGNQLTTNLVIPNTVSKGIHTLKAVAFDDVDNSATDTISIQTNTEPVEESLTILDPKNGQTIQKNTATYTVVVTTKNISAIESISVYAQQSGNSEKTLIGQIKKPSSPFLTFDWPLPANGDWILTAIAEPTSGGTLSTLGTVVSLQNGSGSLSDSQPPTTSLDPFAQ